MFVPFRVSSNPVRLTDRLGWTVEESGCHIWQNGKDHYGYGSVSVDGKCDLVYRIRYRREVGPVPSGMVLDHFACDNKACCNPAHLRPVTRRENNLRSNSLAARKAGRTHCDNGHELVGDNPIPSRMRVENNRLCKTCYNERRKVWRKARLERGCLK